MAALKTQQTTGQDSFAESMSLARTAWAAGDFNSSFEHAKAIVAAYPSKPQGFMLMAQSLAALNRIDESLSILREGNAIHPDNRKLLGIFRSIALIYGRFDDALESALKLLELHPEDPKSHVFLYMCYMGMGSIDLADRLLAKPSGLDKWPSVAKLSVYLNQYYRLKESFPELVSAWESCLRAGNSRHDPEESPPIKLPIIQYWSQGAPPADVALIVSNWNRILRDGGLDEVLLFSRESAESWIGLNAPEFGKAFSGAFHYAMESDIFRIAYASRAPCVYIDIDCWPLEHTVQILKFGMKTGRSMLYFRAYRPWVGNGFFIARPNCYFFSELVRQCREITYDALPKNHSTIESTYGPSRYNDVLYKVLREHEHSREPDASSPGGCSSIRFRESELYFTHEAAVASVKPPFPLGYKTTKDYWKGVSLPQ